MIKRKQGIEIGETHLKTHMSLFASNVLFTLKIMKFENVDLTKVIYFYVLKITNA
jgi:hypothetical protein